MLSLESQANIAEIIQSNAEALSNDTLEEAIKQCDEIFPLKHPVKLPGNLVYLNDDLQNLNGPNNALLELAFGHMENLTDPRTRSNSRGRKSFKISRKEIAPRTRTEVREEDRGL